MTQRVLFVSHDADRTGAPLLLLNLLTWLEQNSDLRFEVLLRGPGSLQEDFAALAPTHLYQRQGAKGNYFTRVCRSLGLGDLPARLNHARLLRRFRAARFDLIYSNTLTNGDILKTLAVLDCPVLTHVHELDYWIERSGIKNLRRVRKHTNHFIACSHYVKANLVDKYDFATDEVDVVHEFIPVRRAAADGTEIRRRLGIPREAFMVLGSGHETWRKGKDLFVQLAARMLKSFPERELHFLWVGGWQNDGDRRNILHDAKQLGLTGRLHWSGPVSNPHDYFAAGDVFAMVSREDPFPLVCLEAASLGKPVICFAGAGGMPEFVAQGAGVAVPYLDLDAMAEAIASLSRDSDARRKLGETAAALVLEFYDVAIGAKRIEQIILREIEAMSGRSSNSSE